MVSVRKNEPVLAAPEERPVFRKLDNFMLKAEDTRVPKLISPEGEEIELPGSLFHLMRQVVHDMAQGKAVTLISGQHVLTTQQAADILNVSRPFLVKLLETGEIPYSRTGAHRRVRLSDLLAYKQRRDSQRGQALTRLTQLGEEMGDYD
jgi:excisionase family DNA binding protein